MKEFFLIIIVACLITSITYGQTKPKLRTNVQPSKPSKEVTLNYINEKLQIYAVEYHKSIKNWGTWDFSNINGGTQNFANYQDWWSSGYKIFESNNRLYIQTTWTRRIRETEQYYDGTWGTKKDESYSWTETAPLDQLANIQVRRSRTYESPGYPYTSQDGSKYNEITSYDNDDLLFNFSSNCALNVFSDNSKEYINSTVICLREGEENLLEKVKKAFLNLQTYYPKPVGDPFGN